MRRFVGLLLVAPLATVVPFMVRSCHRAGPARDAGSDLTDNLLTALFILGLPLAIVGCKMLFGRLPASAGPKAPGPRG